MRSGRTAAQWFCAVGGAVLLVRGLVGFLVLDSSFATPGEGWHHLIHLVSGVALLAAAGSPGAAVAGALGFGVAYGSVAVLGIADGDDVLGLIGADALDKTFHTLIALTSLAAGAVSLRPARAGVAA